MDIERLILNLFTIGFIYKIVTWGSTSPLLLKSHTYFASFNGQKFTHLELTLVIFTEMVYT